jgi:hypothetical protein
MVDHFNDLSVLKPDCVRYRSELTADTPSGHFLVKTLPREDADTPTRRYADTFLYPGFPTCSTI